MRKEIKTVLMFLILGLAASAWADEKIYDPMDVFKRDVPPNILISVDNSGSMARDVDGSYLYDMRTRQNIDDGYSRATVGDFWHFNFPGINHRYDPKPAQWPYWKTGINATLGYSDISTSIAVTDTGTVEDVVLAVDVWIPQSKVADNTSITFTLSKDGKSRTINPKNHWYKIRQSTGDSGHQDWTRINGVNYLRYRVRYAFTDFYKLDKKGTWRITAKDTGGNGAILSDAFLHFQPKLSKMTILKVVLQRLINSTTNARLALGSYGSRWYNNRHGVVDGEGNILTGYRHVWLMSTSNGGFKNLVDWPSDPLDTMSNHNELLDWVNFNAVGGNYFTGNGEYGSPTYTRELMARGGTPIGYCMRDIAAYVASASSSSSDPSTSCRNYSVIFLTDGYCTSGSCGSTYVENRIGDIYNAHSVTSANGDTVGTKTYIIGFAMGTNSSTLNGYATAGHTDADNDPSNGNQAYAPNSSEELLQVFKDAIAHASTQTFTGETQVIPVKLNPDLQNKKDSNGSPYLVWQDRVEDAIIQSFFTYSNGDGFKGHLRAYGILKPDGTLLGNAQYRPIWDVSDWSETLRDDQGQPLSSEPVNRRGTIDERIDHIKAYITPDPTEANYVGSTSAKVPFRESFRCIVTPDSASNGSSLVYLNAYSYRHQKHRYKPSHQLISFVKDRTGIETNSEAVEFIDFLQTKTMGDSTYSTPAIIGAPDSHYPDDTYNAFVNAHKDREKVIYIGANDGMLHCLDAHTGDELWAFIPYDLFPRLMNIFNQYKLTGDLSGQPDPKGASTDPLGRKPHYYYLASSPRYTDIKDSQGNWMTVLTIGEGGGGNAYTSLNVTEPEIRGFNSDGNFYPGDDSETPDDAMDNPSRINLAYTIDNGNDLYLWSTASSSQFSDMGETWSTPSYTRYDKDNFVGYFGSGYPGYGGSGSTLYAVDLSNGEMLDSKQIDSGRSIMCSPGALVGSDNTVYAVYFGDTKGGLWRYVPDMNGINSLGNSHMDKIFQSMYGTTIFDTPALLLDSNGVVWISTGEMGSEAGGSVVDDSVLYTVKDDAGYDQHPAPVYTPSDMVDMNAFESANGVNTVVGRDDVMGPDDKGYFYQLPVRETLFTSPIITGYTLNELAYTTTLYLTYRYPQQGNYCSLGESNLYIFGLASMFIADEEGDNNGANLVGEGKPGSPFESEAGDIWLNTPSGPVRVVNAQGEGLGTGSASQDVDAQTLGKSGGWYTK